MADLVVLASIVSSAAVALGNILVSARSAQQQRRHEAGLAFEERVWAIKSSGLFDLISECRALADDLGQNMDAAAHNIAIQRSRERLNELVPVVEALGSADCRQTLHRLRSTMRETDVNVQTLNAIDSLRRKRKRAALDQDSQREAELRRQENRLREQVGGQLTVRAEEIAEQVEALADAARASIRGRED